VLVASLVLGAQSLHGQADALFINPQGKVFIGPIAAQPACAWCESLEVNGGLRVLSGSNPLRFSVAWDGFSVSGVNEAEISNDTTGVKSLLIVGNKSRDNKTRRVTIWDRLGIGNANTGAALDVKPYCREWISDGGVNKCKEYSMPFSVTDPKSDKNWLTVEQDGRVLMNGGNVGIGTTNPKAPLEVGGSALVGQYTWLGTAWSRYLKIAGSNKPGAVTIQVVNTFGHDYPDSEVPLILQPAAGNVGIGTSDPKAKLDVNGDLKVTGKLILPDGWRILTSTGDKGPRLIFSNEQKGLVTNIMAINVGDLLQYQMQESKYLPAGFQKLGVYENRYAYWTVESDRRLKTDIRAISSALDKINTLNGITYHWNQAGLDYFTRDIEQTVSAGPDATPEANQKIWEAERTRRYKELSNTNVGVVAQDVEAVLPEAVTTDDAGYKKVAYYELIPLLIEAIKEEDKISKEQAQTIARQQSEIQQLTAANEAAQQQLAELRELKQKLARLENTVSQLMVSEYPGDGDKPANAGSSSAGHSAGSE
jgi:hypothetical protein